MTEPKKLTPTTKTVDALAELYAEGRLDLTPDFQRNSVWPSAAKAYLVDTILCDMPIPLLFLSRQRDTNTNRLAYRVIDGQQRLRAAIAFLGDRLTIPNKYGITNSAGREMKRIRYRHLPDNLKERFIGYNFVVTELGGFSDEELRDIFVRINKYVVKLNLQEMRDAQHPGPFRAFVDRCIEDTIWERLGVFSGANRDRKRDKEFIAELAVLFLEGPQDKKGSLELYYAADADQFDADEMMQEMIETAELAAAILGDEPPTLLLRLPAFYGLMGALFNIRSNEPAAETLKANIDKAQDALETLAQEVEELPALDSTSGADPDEEASLLLSARVFQRSVSRQTDNVKPRTARIDVLERTILADLGQ